MLLRDLFERWSVSVIANLYSFIHGHKITNLTGNSIMDMDLASYRTQSNAFTEGLET